MKGNRKIAVSALLSLAAAAWFTGPVYADDQKIRRVLVISIDGMHALDLALWVKNNPNSALGQIAARGMNYTNASTMKPSDSIPSTAGIFTGGTPAVTGMYYDDAYNRAWFAPANTNCTGAPGSVIDLKQGIDFNPGAADGGGGVDPAKVPRQLVNGVCTPVMPYNMIRVNTVFEVIKAAHGRTAYSEKRPSYGFLNGPSGTGIDDLYTPEIAFNNILNSLSLTEAFDDDRVQSVLNEIDGKDHTGLLNVGVPTIFGMNFQAINAAKKDSLRGGYADDIGTPNSALNDALTHTDASIGRFVNELRAQGLSDTTAVIITAKHGETALDPSERFIVTTSAIQNVLTPAGFPPSTIAKLTEKSTALIWLKDQSQTQAVVSVLTTKANETSLRIAQILSGESLKLLFPDPLTDPAPPDIILIPFAGTNYEPSLNPALPAVQAEHGGFNENDLHVPLLVAHPSIPYGQSRAPVTTTQIAPTILNLLGLDANQLQAVQLEGTRVLPGIPTQGGVDNGHLGSH